jgi:hypothetical protein
MVKDAVAVEQGRRRPCVMERELARIKDFPQNIWRRLPDDETLLLAVHVYFHRSPSQVQAGVLRVTHSPRVPLRAHQLTLKRITRQVKSLNLLRPRFLLID